MKEVVQSWKATDMNALMDALNEACDLTRAEGVTADTVNTEGEVSVSLIRETLTDGSHVFNVALKTKDSL